MLSVNHGFSVVALCLALNSPMPGATKAIRLGKLWDGHKVVPNAVIVVENDVIRSVIANGTVPAGADLIDLRRYSGIPGLIDSHTHITYFWNGAPDTTPLRQPRRHVAVTVYLAQENARKALEAGVTTVRDLGAS